MGTKDKPSKFNCYERAKSDEPLFTLLGRDPVASVLVFEWVRIRKALDKTEKEVLEEAIESAQSMRDYALKLKKRDEILRAQVLLSFPPNSGREF